MILVRLLDFIQSFNESVVSKLLMTFELIDNFEFSVPRKLALNSLISEQLLFVSDDQVKVEPSNHLVLFRDPTKLNFPFVAAREMRRKKLVVIFKGVITNVVVTGWKWARLPRHNDVLVTLIIFEILAECFIVKRFANFVDCLVAILLVLATLKVESCDNESVAVVDGRVDFVGSI